MSNSEAKPLAPNSVAMSLRVAAAVMRSRSALTGASPLASMAP